ncbi:MAG: hypothetical protein E7007_03330 [Alphaproteobacteria bacterium]|nr:hypothetical protein [Alphaproteobacteria bacterium]
MTKDFYTEHDKQIKSTVEKNQVKYTVGSGNGTNAVVHCYYVDNKNVRMAAYAIRNKTTKATHKYILKLMVKSDTKNQKSVVSVRDTGAYAKQLFNLLEAKYTRQVARTQLKSGWRNPVFIIHKQR